MTKWKCSFSNRHRSQIERIQDVQIWRSDARSFEFAFAWIVQSHSKAYSETCQTSKMERFAKIKGSILDVWHDCK